MVWHLEVNPQEDLRTHWIIRFSQAKGNDDERDMWWVIQSFKKKKCYVNTNIPLCFPRTFSNPMSSWFNLQLAGLVQGWNGENEYVLSERPRFQLSTGGCSSQAFHFMTAVHLFVLISWLGLTVYDTLPIPYGSSSNSKKIKCCSQQDLIRCSFQNDIHNVAQSISHRQPLFKLSGWLRFFPPFQCNLDFSMNISIENLFEKDFCSRQQQIGISGQDSSK